MAPQCPHSFLLHIKVPPLSPAAAGTAFLDQLRASFLSRMERVKGELTTMVDDAGGCCAREGWKEGHALADFCTAVFVPCCACLQPPDAQA